jgi:hypothetical protein
MVVGHLGWEADADVAYLGERPSGPTLYEPAPQAAGGPLLLVTVDGLGEERAALERRLGPLQPAGEADAYDGGRLVRRYRFYRWLPRPAGSRPGVRRAARHRGRPPLRGAGTGAYRGPALAGAMQAGAAIHSLPLVAALAVAGPPAELEATYYRGRATPAMVAGLEQPGLR